MRRLRLPTAALRVGLVVAFGVAIGVGSHTFRYAEGLSYLKTDPDACANCHIMQPQYDGWQRASHHTSAVCVDCHLPAEFPAKYVAKLENGWRHGEKFTTQTFDEPLRVGPAGERILEANCRRCHDAVVRDSFGESHGSGLIVDPSHDASLRCTHCHAGVGHGVRALVGGPQSSASRK
ncbi:MAG: cytochrome c nitrite reductase small subunit [Polyangiaceae bacterium]|nr:cytochrome c nitrite reductase small subunit [Polyangiaceae bacterium]MCB9610027.1 cytochrome c nitrite reductase small subunit [Polyangiaceae bacterium]